MQYRVTIIYSGRNPAGDIRTSAPIMRTFVPGNSYIDTIGLEDTVYDTNTPGFGYIDVMEPYATTSFPFPVPLAQFKLAALSVDQGTPGTVTFVVDSYMEASWYVQAGISMESQGFIVNVEEVEEDDNGDGDGDGGGEEPVAVAVTGVTLDESTLAMVIQGTDVLTATIAPAGATNKAVAWSSANETIATVVQDVDDGLKATVTALAQGTCKITVTTADGSFTADCDVTVSES